MVENVSTATFTYRVDSIRTADIGDMNDVVKYVEFTVKGTQDGQSFDLPQKIELSDPEAQSFIPFSDLSETEVVSWIENSFENLEAVKSHIQSVINLQLQKASFTANVLPWAPVTANTPAPDMSANTAG